MTQDSVRRFGVEGLGFDIRGMGWGVKWGRSGEHGLELKSNRLGFRVL